MSVSELRKYFTLQALQTLQELPLSLIAESPAHIPNWDLVADIVNGCSRTYRSPKQCKNRFENFISAREEGRAVYDPSPRKMKKTVKGLYKVFSTSSMSQITFGWLSYWFVIVFIHDKSLTSDKHLYILQFCVNYACFCHSGVAVSRTFYT